MIFLSVAKKFAMRYKSRMLNKGINVRLEPRIRERLEAIASRSGVKASVLIRQAIEEYCTSIEATGVISFKIGGDITGGTNISGGTGHNISQHNVFSSASARVKEEGREAHKRPGKSSRKNTPNKKSKENG